MCRITTSFQMTYIIFKKEISFSLLVLYPIKSVFLIVCVSKSMCLTDLEQFPWRKDDRTKTSRSYYVFGISSELISLPTSAALVNLWASAVFNNSVLLLLLLILCQM